MKKPEKGELVKFRLSKAKGTLDEVEILISNGLLNTAVNRLYYSCFYAVSALLLANDLATKTHSGVRMSLGQHFIKTGIISETSGKFFREIFDLRQSGDYQDFILFEREQVVTLIDPAKALLAEIEKILEIE